MKNYSIEYSKITSDNLSFTNAYRLNDDECNFQSSFRVNGILHREDGPAVTTNLGKELYYLEGIKMSKKEFLLRQIANVS
jgi:hypothetical protein